MIAAFAACFPIWNLRLVSLSRVALSGVRSHSQETPLRWPKRFAVKGNSPRYCCAPSKNRGSRQAFRRTLPTPSQLSLSESGYRVEGRSKGRAVSSRHPLFKGNGRLSEEDCSFQVLVQFHDRSHKGIQFGLHNFIGEPKQKGGGANRPWLSRNRLKVFLYFLFKPNPAKGIPLSNAPQNLTLNHPRKVEGAREPAGAPAGKSGRFPGPQNPGSHPPERASAVGPSKRPLVTLSDPKRHWTLQKGQDLHKGTSKGHLRRAVVKAHDASGSGPFER